LQVTSTHSAPVTRYNSAEFHQTVLDISPKVAVFDCDGTLWSGDSGMGFMTWSMDVGLLSRNSSEWIDSRHRLYRRGEVSELEICGEMVQVYAGLREEELRRAAAEYFRTHIETQIFPELQTLIQKLQAVNTEIWAVSSTNNWVIEEGVRHFNIPASHALAAQVKSADGLITSQLIDVPTDEGKAVALKRVGVPNPDAVFGNSVHDAAMLELAKQAFPVNPTPGLLEISASRGWAVYYPESILADHIK
jgi:phosphoserine phosphatase